jgi:ketosteroid isomerase-like protein
MTSIQADRAGRRRQGADSGAPSAEDHAAVLAAAAELVRAFGTHDTSAYFACFAEDATFLFHTTKDFVPSRAAYERRWREWEADGFQVIGCRSLEPRVLLVSTGAAVYTHRVRTRLQGVDEVIAERETIVFRRTGSGRWLGVHEHLSADPEGDAEDQRGSDRP